MAVFLVMDSEVECKTLNEDRQEKSSAWSR